MRHLPQGMLHPPFHLSAKQLVLALFGIALNFYKSVDGAYDSACIVTVTAHGSARGDDDFSEERLGAVGCRRKVYPARTDAANDDA